MMRLAFCVRRTGEAISFENPNHGKCYVLPSKEENLYLSFSLGV